MEFLDFYRLGKNVLEPQHLSQSPVLQRLAQQTTKKWPVLQVLALKHCYRQLFPFPTSVPSSVNDTLLDLDPVKDFSVQELILVQRKHNVFCFRLEEILSIFHNDLSRSVLEYEPQYHILTLTKAFRLPTHPYLQEPFTLDEIRQIMNQMVLKFDALPREFPIVYLFLRHAKTILDTCSSLSSSNYETTKCLEHLLEQHQTRFIEKFTVKTRENHSYWDLTFPKSVRTEKQMYLWFLEMIAH